MSLDRFRTAQASPAAGFATALAELHSGRKTSHWIWYIFPQLAGLGHSSTAQHYALRDLTEACDYLSDPVLRSRFAQATEAVARQLDDGDQLVALMGGRTDALKLVSSLTLFQLAARRLASSGAAMDFTELAARCEKVLATAAMQGFPPCAFTSASVARVS